MKNNKVWFRAKKYGWGWVPITWEGWLAIAIFVALLIVNMDMFTAVGHPTDGQSVWFLVRTGILVGLLICVCYEKGEKPRWRWGEKK